VAYAYAKQLEVPRRVKELLQDRDPDSVPEMDHIDLVEKYKKLMKEGQEHKENELSKVFHMYMIIKEQGMQSLVICQEFTFFFFDICSCLFKLLIVFFYRAWVLFTRFQRCQQ